MSSGFSLVTRVLPRTFCMASRKASFVRPNSLKMLRMAPLGRSIMPSRMCSTEMNSSFMYWACCSASVSAASTDWEMYTLSISRPGPDTLGMRWISRSQAVAMRLVSILAFFRIWAAAPSSWFSRAYSRCCWSICMFWLRMAQLWASRMASMDFWVNFSMFIFLPPFRVVVGFKVNLTFFDYYSVSPGFVNSFVRKKYKINKISALQPKAVAVKPLAFQQQSTIIEATMLTGDSTMNDLIGFFDSGVGGISVLHEARRLLPNEHFLFYGDNLHAPYGPRPLEEIRALSAAGIDILFSRGVKAIVIACNTATSAYAEIVRKAHPELPIVGMEPALKPAHFARHGGKVIVLATDATLRLEKFERLMRLYGDDVITVVGQGLVELVESGRARSPERVRGSKRCWLPTGMSRSTPSCWGAPITPSSASRSSASFPRLKFSTV